MAVIQSRPLREDLAKSSGSAVLEFVLLLAPALMLFYLVLGISIDSFTRLEALRVAVLAARTASAADYGDVPVTDLLPAKEQPTFGRLTNLGLRSSGSEVQACVDYFTSFRTAQICWTSLKEGLR